MSNINPTATPSSAPPIDSDDEDEDYVPQADNDSDEGGDENHNKKENTDNKYDTPHLSNSKRKAVDDAFASLFGSTTTITPTTSVDKKKNQKNSKKSMRKKKRVLAEIFGGTEASKILATANKNKTARTNNGRERALPTLEKKTIKEVKKFAGQEICVERQVVVPVTDTAQQQQQQQRQRQRQDERPQPNKKSGLDNILSELAGPQKISTVAKTSSDWDSFKDKSGLEDELEKKAQDKDAYLVKKEFLQRVDLRRFEHEKTDREKKRAAAAAAMGK